MYHRIRTIEAMDDYMLRAVFLDGSIRIYDVKPLFDEIEVFQNLKNITGLFEQVRVDANGYGICWNDEIDLECDELWINGSKEEER